MVKSNRLLIKDLAQFILLHCIKNEISINHFKLQKLLYYTQAWHLVYFEGNNMFDELPEAWVNGPVYKSIYQDWRHIYAAQGITIRDDHRVQLEDNYNKSLETLKLNASQMKFISSILNYYGLMSHDKLILLTHQESPWNEARNGIGDFEYSSTKITKESMNKYYGDLLNRKSNAGV